MVVDEARFEQWWRSLTRSQQVEAGELGRGAVMPTWMVPGVIRYFGPVDAAPATAGPLGFVFPDGVHDRVHPAAGAS